MTQEPRTGTRRLTSPEQPFVVVGCTGGIGSGKSTVTALLAERGASVIDTDVVARAAIQRGGAAHQDLTRRFGDAVAPDGSVDRARIASMVFSDPAARADLEAIVHPEVRRAVLGEIEEQRSSGGVVVVELPLLVETGGRERYGLDAVLAVDAPEEIVAERLQRRRGMSVEAVAARLAAQAARGERVRAADFVIVNVGTLDELTQMVGEAWRWIEQLLRGW